MIDGSEAVDESRILLDLLAYFGKTVFELLEHGEEVVEVTDKSRVETGVCFLALLEKNKIFDLKFFVVEAFNYEHRCTQEEGRGRYKKDPSRKTEKHINKNAIKLKAV